VKTAVLAPIPSASEITATAAKTGDFARERTTNRNSLGKLMDLSTETVPPLVPVSVGLRR
jgi:hypothetical protein